MSYQIFLVEDEENLHCVLKSYLEKEGFEVRSFFDGQQAMQATTDFSELWILDVMLPHVDGYELIKEIKKETPHVPVIFISARDDDLDKIVGLEMGSDDYLSKPFLPKELVIRTKRLLERVYGKPSLSSSFLIHGYEISEAERSIFFQKEEIEATSKEFDLLLVFIKNQGKSFTRDELLQLVWGEGYFGSDRVVDDLIRRLRKKMPAIKIETIYGVGYKFI